jgi:uncharacterized protein (DUF1697 family)
MGAQSRYVAFLRGINVGGKNKLPMKDLAAMFEKAGGSDVRTYIQSGNVIFGAPAKLASAIAATVAGRIASDFGFHSPVVVRSQAQLQQAVDGNPFLQKKLDPALLHVYFLADLPPAQLVASLDPARSAPDEFVVDGQQIYLHLPNGMARTRLSNAWFDSKLKTVSTARNWRTTTALLQLMVSPGP